MRTDVCIFVISHNRPHNETCKLLKSLDVKTPVYVVIDDGDKCIDEYKSVYGENNVVIFNKQDVHDRMGFDNMSNDTNYGVILFARNFCFEAAEKLGFKYFIELDDDYKELEWGGYEANGKFKRVYHTAGKPRLRGKFDCILSKVVDYFESCGFTALAFAQNGDMIGGMERFVNKNVLKRKAMNTIICSTERKFLFNGLINEDVNNYVLNGSRGALIGTFPHITIQQEHTQYGHKDGMSTTYNDTGTYIKSFYSILCCPSSVRIHSMGNNDLRIHHKVLWKYAVPKIVSSDFRVE